MYMYMNCMYSVCTVYIHVDSMYIHGITCALDNGDQGSPCPEDGDFFYARPDAEETEEAINKFMTE